ncbi:MAG: ABC transporter substrate-binding protein [Halobacteriaceae archaeon]
MRRRDFMAAGGAALTAGLAGCSSLSGGSSGGDVTHTVSMEPVGEVGLTGVPETVATYFPSYAEMAVALGHGDAVASVGVKSRYHTDVYDELDGVSLDKSALTPLWDGGIDTEVFHNIDADLHLIDPNWLTNNFKGIAQSDVESLTDRVAPFLGNTIFRRTDDWHDYRYYTLYEAFEKVAKVFQEQDRYDEFATFHDETVSAVQDSLPEERPSAALVFEYSDEPTDFSPSRISDGGTNKKQFRDLGVMDAFEGTDIEGISTSQRATIGYESLLDVDPDVLLIRGHEGKTREEFVNGPVAFMKNHDVASQLTAVENDDVYRGGPVYGGPIQHLFLLERFGSLLFPDAVSEPVFDRAELASIITG